MTVGDRRRPLAVAAFYVSTPPAMCRSEMIKRMRLLCGAHLQSASLLPKDSGRGGNDASIPLLFGLFVRGAVIPDLLQAFDVLVAMT